MTIQSTPLNGAYILETEKKEDDRGYFARIFDQNILKKYGLDANVIQSSFSYNKTKGTLRGMHYQKEPYGETKIIRCIKGALYDVIIDIRPHSPTYKQWLGLELSAKNVNALYIPKGFAHGFITLEDHTEAMYFISQVYTPNAEGGLRYDDPAFNISWPIKPTILSQRDKDWPLF